MANTEPKSIIDLLLELSSKDYDNSTITLIYKEDEHREPTEIQLLELVSSNEYFNFSIRGFVKDTHNMKTLPIIKYGKLLVTHIIADLRDNTQILHDLTTLPLLPDNAEECYTNLYNKIYEFLVNDAELSNRISILNTFTKEYILTENIEVPKYTYESSPKSDDQPKVEVQCVEYGLAKKIVSTYNLESERMNVLNYEECSNKLTELRREKTIGRFYCRLLAYVDSLLHPESLISEDIEVTSIHGTKEIIYRKVSNKLV